LQYRGLLIGIVCGADLASANAQPTADGRGSEAGGKSFSIARAVSAPVIDGRLDDSVWSTATLIDDLHQLSPVEYAAASERTEIRVAYDDDALYIGAKLWYGDPSDVTAQVLRQGEGLGNEDRITVILDPYLDRRNGYRFEINANGVHWDALYQNTTSVESNWEGIWLGAAERSADGWTAEMAIPFKTLSFNPNNDSWGINFERAIQRKDETLAWVSRNRQVNPGVAGTVTGLEGINQGLGLDIVPSMAVTQRRTYGPTDASSNDLEPSLDLFYKITPSLNGALTLNTDFSATEVDDRQVNLTRFSLFFPEKRDFFLQDADIFEFGRIGENSGGFGGGGGGDSSAQNGRPFFSRNLGLSSLGEPVDIDYGGKLSGRVGRWNVGALSIHQAAQADVDESDVFVGRVAANVLDESAVGVIVTDGDPQSNLDSTLAGADFRYRNSRLAGGRVLEGETWYQETTTQGIEGDNRAFGFGINSPNNTGLRGSLSARQIEQNFDPAVGFVNETGIRNYTLNMGYRYRFRDRILRSVFGGLEASRVERLADGEVDRQNVGFRLNIEGSSQERGVFSITAHKENIPTDFVIYEEPGTPEQRQVVIPQGDYQWTGFFIGTRTADHRKISGFFGTNFGEFYDGNRFQVNTDFNWRPSEHFRLSLSYSVNQVSLPDGDFAVRIGSLRAQYAFSSTLSWVNLIQYDNVSEVLGFNSRLHWIPQAGREGYIVFNHSLADPDKKGSFHSTEADFTVKFNYTFRF
jgi:Carbohydrate family 9 binding domain-like/Domain of unknown function (DUF5916)